MPPLDPNTEELLLLCSQRVLTGIQKERARALVREGIDWEHFLGSAIRGGATLLVYDALSKITPSVKIPPQVLDRLKSASLFIIQKATCQYTELTSLLRLFAERKIPVAPLKGVILAKRLYGDIAGRSLSVDYDLLIEEKNKEPARALLEKAGYSFNPTEQIIRPWQYNFAKEKAVMIDLHWDITRLYRSEERMEELWRGMKLIEQDGVSYYEFKEDELLLYLSAQMLNGCSFRQLKYACDINRLLYNYKDRLNWSKIIKKAKRWRISNSLYAVLKLSRDLFDSDLPPEALKRLKPNPMKCILLNLFVNKKVILQRGFSRRFLDNFLKYIFFELIEAESAKEYFSIIFPPRRVRGKGWAARIAKGASALSGMLAKRKANR